MKRTLMVLIALACLASSVQAANVLFVPPQVPYTSGCADGSSSQLMINNLGRNIYFSMSAAVAEFNASREAIKNQIFFRSLSMAYPSCGNNDKIDKFYKGTRLPPEGFLQKILQENDLDMIVWSDFRSANVRECLAGKGDGCGVNAFLKIYDGEKTVGEGLPLWFDRQKKNFSKKSLRRVTEKIKTGFADHSLPSAPQ